MSLFELVNQANIRNVVGERFGAAFESVDLSDLTDDEQTAAVALNSAALFAAVVNTIGRDDAEMLLDGVLAFLSFADTEAELGAAHEPASVH